jgi:hypothetical protein
VIARKKGYSFVGYWLFGLLFFLPALIVALLKQPRSLPPTAGATRPCPHCRTVIPSAATVCPQCRRDIAPPTPRARSGARSERQVPAAYMSVAAARDDAVGSSAAPRCDNPECLGYRRRVSGIRCDLCGRKPNAENPHVQPQSFAAQIGVLAKPSTSAVGESRICVEQTCAGSSVWTTAQTCQRCGRVTVPVEENPR